MAEFVITYKRRSGESFIKQFSDSAEALKERLRREAAIYDPDTEIAHISSPSLESLKSRIHGISWATLRCKATRRTQTKASLMISPPWA